MADTSVEKGYSGLERFMFFMIPILFVVVLLGVLLMMFDTDFRNRALQFGQSIPVIKNVLPEPKVAGGSMNDDQIRSIMMSDKISELETELGRLRIELEEANAAQGLQEQTVQDLQDANAQLQQLTIEQRLDDEQYAAKISELANMFAKMMPGRAAPIVQNMTVDEMVLLFDSMRPDDRVKIMEKMDPRIAAEAAIKLKDNVTAKDLQIAALQARLNEETLAEPQVSSTLNDEQLSATFNTMNAKSAGEMLLKMNDISPSKVLRILNTVNDAARSSILAEMSKVNETATANIMTRLTPGT